MRVNSFDESEAPNEPPASAPAVTAEPEDDHDEAETLGFVCDTIMRAKYRLEFEELSPEVKRGLRRIIAEGERAQAFVTAQATELAALREALAKFGHHSGGCNLHNRIPFTEQARREYYAKGLNGCTCGLTAALAPHQTTKKEK